MEPSDSERKGEAKRQAEARHWCFTVFCVDPPAFDEALHGYLCYQQETCPETGRVHWQGYVEFHAKRRLTAIKKLPGWHQSAHWEKRRGTPDEAVAYCRKPDTAVEGTFAEFGTAFHAGRKRALSSAIAHVCADAVLGVKRVAIEQPELFVAHWRGLERLAMYVRQDSAPARDWIPEVRWYYGPSGSGKSRAVRDENPGKTVHAISFSEFAKGWWSGYLSADIVCIEDWSFFPVKDGVENKNDTMVGMLLNACDYYWCDLPVKGGHVPNAFRKLYITSNFHWSDCFIGMTQERIASFKRRLFDEKLFLNLVPDRSEVARSATEAP